MQTNSLTLPSPAKLNLFLHITGRRADGYHNLQTLFQLLDYGDEIQLTLNQTGRVTLLNQIEGVATEQNLIYRAAQLLVPYKQPEQGAEIGFQKQLPMGGGIGGGSSNAATVLIGLNHLWNLQLSNGKLCELGASLGADIPVFVKGRTAWAEGIGEQLTPIDLPEKWYLILAPDCHVSTVEIFSHKDLTRDHRPITVAAFLDSGGQNDCQTVVTKLYPEVGEAMNWLNKYSHAQMTGTGACVFAPFPDRQRAEAVFAQCPLNVRGFIAKGVNHSPLHQRLP